MTDPTPVWISLEDAVRAFGFKHILALSEWRRRTVKKTGVPIRRLRGRIHFADLQAALDREAQTFDALGTARGEALRQRPNLKTARP